MSLEKFQKKIGTTPDGVFGKQTMKAAMRYYNLSPEKAAHFFAQCSHETGGFKVFEENLNYSRDALYRVFSKYFPSNELLNSYAKRPEAIANRVYANRIGNGDEASGDGWRYRGRGALQLTGKANYRSFEKYLGKEIDPEEVAEEYAFESAFFFFDRNNLWGICKTVTDESILKLTKRVNGGTNGLEHRKSLTYKYYNLVK